MKERYCLIAAIWVLSLVLLLPSVLFASQGINSSSSYDAYGLTNSNSDQTAVFWVKTMGGKTSLVEVPPKSEKKLPLDTVDFQFLFMEKVTPPVPSMGNIGSMAFAGEQEAVEADALKYYESKSSSISDAAAQSVPSIEGSRPEQKFGKVRQFFAENW